MTVLEALRLARGTCHLSYARLEGPAQRVAVRQWRGLGPPEPWKAGKNRLLAIFTHKFPAETCSIFIANRRCALRGAIGLQMGKNCMEFDRTRRAGHSKKRNAVQIKKKFLKSANSHYREWNFRYTL